MHAHADDELDPLHSEEAEQHLRTCSACSSAYENLLILKKSLSAAAFTAPDGLREQLSAALRRAEPSSPFAVRRGFRPWLLTGLAVAASVLVGFFLGQNLHPSSQALVAQIIDSHIRSLVGTHLVDVTSSDQHTVRPWFEGKLDFAPPVVDLAAQEFPLVGGRVEYIGGRPVAALVYQRRKHFINLFMWPSGNGSEPVSTTRPQRGYNALHWREHGMNFWAVSEVSEEDLRKFAVAFSETAGR